MTRAAPPLRNKSDAAALQDGVRVRQNDYDPLESDS